MRRIRKYVERILCADRELKRYSGTGERDCFKTLARLVLAVDFGLATREDIEDAFHRRDSERIRRENTPALRSRKSRYTDAVQRIAKLIADRERYSERTHGKALRLRRKPPRANGAKLRLPKVPEYPESLRQGEPDDVLSKDWQGVSEWSWRRARGVWKRARGLKRLRWVKS